MARLTLGARARGAGRIAIIAGAALLLQTCGGDTLAPGPFRPASIQVRPVLPAPALAGSLVMDSVQLYVIRPANDTILSDGRRFPVNSQQLSLSENLTLHSGTEDLLVVVELYAGPLLLFQGSQTVTVSAAGVGSNGPITIPLAFVGPGANVATVLLAPRDTTLTSGAGFTFRVSARDGQGAPVSQFYASWSTSAATVPIDANGHLTAPAVRDTIVVHVVAWNGVEDSTTVRFLPPPTQLLISSGDGQTAAVDTRLPLPLAVGVRGADNLPIPGIRVAFAVATGGGSVDSATATTDATGIARSGVVLGALVGSQTFTATLAGAPPVTFTETATGVGPVTRTWTGATSTAWATAANWSPAGVPAAVDNVVVPAGAPRYPILTTTVSMNDLTIQTGASLDRGTSTGIQLNLTGSLDASGPITGTAPTNAAVMTGTGVTLRGTIGGIVFVNGVAALNGRTVADGLGGTGQLTIGGYTMAVNAGYTLSGLLVMTNPLDSLVIGGTATFGGPDETGKLTAGVIALKGDFGQSSVVSPSSFNAGGSLAVVLNGTGPQIIGFATPASSGFQNLDVSKAVGPISLGSAAIVKATFTSLPSATPPTITSAAQGLQVNSITVSGLTLDNTLLTIGGGTITQFDNVRFQAYASTAQVLTVNHPGRVTPFTFNNLTFAVVPTTGFYLSATDAAPADGTVLTIDVTGSSPAAGAPFVQTSGGAVVTWGAPAALTWTGTVSTDWFVAGNWSPAVVPSATDSVVIGPATAGPVLSGNVTVGAVNVASGSLVLNTHTLTVARTFATSNTGRVVMQGGQDSLLVAGDVVFGGASTSGFLAAGYIRVLGNFTATAVNNPSDFVASGAHTVELAGASGQVVSLANGGQGLERFSNLIVSNAAGGLTFTHSTEVENVLTSRPTGAPPVVASGGTQSLIVKGNLDVTGLTMNAMALQAFFLNTTPVFDNVTFSNQNVSSTQLDLYSYGQPAPFAFNNLTFQTVPSAAGGGRYIRATDQDGTNPTTFILNLVNPSPATSGGFVQALTGAVVNWPGGAPTSRTWTGTLSTDWSDAGNWNPAGIPGALDDLTIGAATNLPTLTANGLANSLLLTGGGADLILNGHTLVLGSLNANNGAHLTLTQPLDSLQVTGNVDLDLGDETNNLTGGVFELGGNFVQRGNNASTSFAASGTRTVLTGSAGQTLTFFNPGAALSHFHDLIINKTGGGVSLNSSVFVNDSMAITSATIMSGSQGLTVARKLRTAPGAVLAMGGLIIAGDSLLVATPANYMVSATAFVAAVPQLLPVLPYAELQLSGSSTHTLTGRTVVSGQLTMTAATAELILGGHTLSVGSFLTSSGPHLTMTQPLDSLQVMGAVDFDFADETGRLTAGVIEVGGGFVQRGNVSTASFAPSGTRTVLSGSANQTLTFFNPTAAESHFHDLVINKSAGTVSLGSGVVVTDSMAITSATVLNGGQTLTVQRKLTMGPGASLAIGGLAIAGDSLRVATPANYAVGTTTFFATGPQLLPVLPYTNLTLSGTSTHTLTGSTPASGLVTVTGATAELILGGHTLAAGSFTVSGAARFSLTQALDSLQVAGAVDVDGGDASTRLTAGVFEIGGSFVERGNNGPLDFAASGTRTVLSGTAAQPLTFFHPAAAQSHFHDLVINKTGGAVTLGSAVFVNDSLAISSATVFNGGQTLTVGRKLITAPGAGLAMGGLVVAGDSLLVGTPANYTVGTTTLTASGPQLIPVLPYGNLILSGTSTHTLTGSTPASGLVTVTGATAELILGGHTLAAGSFTVSGAARFSLTQALDSLQVAGAVDLDAGDESARLTAGVFELGGSFVERGNNGPLDFAASGTRTVLSGTAAQPLTFFHPAAAQSHFHDLVINKTGGAVSLGSAVFVNDSLAISSATVFNGGQTLTVSRKLITAPGAGLAMSGLVVVGDSLQVATPVNFTVGSTTLTASGPQLIPVLPYGNLTLSGTSTHTLIGSTPASGLVTVTGANAELILAGHTLAAGSFTVSGAARFSLTQALDSLQVAGAVDLDGGDESARLTAGVFEVGGSFVERGNNGPLDFAASGTRTVLSGGAAQPLTFFHPAAAQSHFHDLVINKTGGAVSLGSAVFVNDSLAISSATVFNGGQTLTVSRKLITAPGAGLAMNALVMAGDSLQVATPANYTVGTTTLTASGPQLIPVLPYGNLTLSGTSTHTLTGRTPASGLVTVTGANAELILGGHTLAAGSFTVSGAARFSLTQPLDSLQVVGAVDLDAGDESARLTAGVFEIGGSFVERGNNGPLDFAASGTRTVLSGGAAQPLTFFHPAAAQSHFHDLVINKTGGAVSLGSPVFVNDSLVISSATVFNGGQTLTVSRKLVAGAGAGLAMNALVVAGDSLQVATPANYTVGTTTLTASGPQLIPVLPYGNLTLSGTSTHTLIGSTPASGLVTVTGANAELILAGHTLAAGSFTVSGAARFSLTQALDSLQVAGAVDLDAGDESARLTAGVFELGGSFVERGNNGPLDFAASGTRTVLSGTAAQPLTFFHPGAAQSHFHDLEIRKSGGTVSLGTPVVVDSALIVQSGTPTITGGQSLTVGALDVTGLTLDNTPLIWTTTKPLQATFDNVTFQAFGSGTNQFTINHPGTVGSPITMSGLTFLSTPTTGFYVSANDTDGGLPLTVVISSNLVPSAAALLTQLLNQAVVTWQ